MKVRSESPRQLQKPAGWFGRVVLWSMNRRHSRLTDWGLEHVTIGAHDTILDVGCGGGRTVSKLAASATAGRVHGIDYSPTSVSAARRTNRQWMEQGRVEIEQASVSDLPFSTDTFHLVTAVETHFWWRDVGAGVREIFRVLRPGGRLVVIAEFYNGGKHVRYVELLSKRTTMAALTADQHRELLVNAGFTDVQVVEEVTRGWICALGRKP